MTKTKRPKIIRVAKRSIPSPFDKIKAYVVPLLFALVLSVLFLWLVGRKNPFTAVKYIFEGTFFITDSGSLSPSRLLAFAKNAIVLLWIALALAPCYKMRYWNIGGQGQVLIGALLTACCRIYLPQTRPNALAVMIAAVVAAIGGAIWSYIPAIFKAKWNTNETLFTLRMNYLAILLVELCTNIWRGSKSALGQINVSNRFGWFYQIPNTAIKNQFLNSNVFFPLMFVAVLVAVRFVYIKYTKHGYERTVVGESLSTARYTGINVRHVIRRTAALSGLLCGLIGFLSVSNFDHSISTFSDFGYGFTAVIVCWLSNFNPFARIGYSSLLVFLERGAKNLSDSQYAAPYLNEYSTQFVIFVIILAFLSATFFLRYQVTLDLPGKQKRRKAKLTKGLLNPAKKEAR